MNRMYALIAATLIGLTPGEVQAMKADYAQHLAQGVEVRYAWMPEADADLIPALMYQVAATTQQPLLDGTVPERVHGTTLWRLNLTALDWRVQDWMDVCGYENNGYTAHENPLWVPADWLLNELADCREGGNAYFKFIFKGKPPKTEDEFLLRFGLDRKSQGIYRYGWVEGESGVHRIKNAARLVEHLDGPNSESWATYDVKKIKGGFDPLRAVLPEKLEYDASEIFVLLPKVKSITADGEGKRGVLAITGLFDGKKAVQVEAPNDIVADVTETFGNDLIINNGSCVSCHTEGAKMPSINALRDRLTKGLELKSYDEQKRIQAELYHLGDVTKSLERWSEDFAVAIKEINGLSTLENSTAYRAALKKYQQDLDLNGVAKFLCVPPETLRLALAWSSVRYIDSGPHVSSLAHGGTLTRDTFESEYLVIKKHLADWSNAQ